MQSFYLSPNTRVLNLKNKHCCKENITRLYSTNSCQIQIKPFWRLGKACTLWYEQFIPWTLYLVATSAQCFQLLTSGRSICPTMFTNLLCLQSFCKICLLIIIQRVKKKLHSKSYTIDKVIGKVSIHFNCVSLLHYIMPNDIYLDKMSCMFPYLVPVSLSLHWLQC